MTSPNGTLVLNTTLPPTVKDITLNIEQGEASAYFIRIAALNQIGQGPFSAPLEVEFDPSILLIPTGKGEGTKTQQNELLLQSNKQVTLIIGVISAALFVLILISAVICYKRKMQSQRKPMGYLAAATSDDFHCQLSRHSGGPIIKGTAEIHAEKRHSKDTNLWIDRRWGGSDSCEKDSNSSEKKLLSLHNQTHSNSNSDTEYAYVENKHNVSSFTNSSGSRKAAESPEPYATTELFQQQAQQHYVATQHYAAPIIVPAGAIPPNHYRRNVHSCDDLSADDRSQHHMPQQYPAQHYLVPHNYQRASTGGTKMKRNKQPKNILDFIPPPPLHPPPPPTSNYNKSQESVISPKYLFAHPMYQGTVGAGNTNRIYGHKIHPNQNRSQHYESVEPLLSSHHQTQQIYQPPQSHQQRLVFDRDCHDELQRFNSVLTQFAGQSSLNSVKSQSSTVKSKNSDQFSLHCEADNEEDVDPPSQN